jgi:hypothetical protein
LLFDAFARRLTSLDIHRTLDDILGPGATMESSWPAHRLGARAVATETEVRELVRVARERARAYVAGRDFGCDLADQACFEELVVGLGQRLYRRPMNVSEVRALSILFDAGGAGESAETRFTAVVEAMIESPHFVFRVELGDQYGNLTPFEVAARIAFFLWRQGPDDELWDAAWSGRLARMEDIEREVARMLADPRAHFGLAELTREWLGLVDFDAFAASVELPDDVKSHMSEQTSRFLTELYGSGDATLNRLLLETRQPMSAVLAQHIDLPTYPETGFVNLTLDPARFSGILTHGTVLVSAPNLSRRGAFVRKVMMCDRWPTSHEMPPTVPGEPTRRATFEGIWASAECWGCHQAIDLTGFGLAGFDELGRAQDEAVDGTLLVDTRDGVPFDGPRGLAELLVNRPEVAHCTAERWFAYALDREFSLVALEAPIGPGGGDPYVSFVTSDCLAAELVSHRNDLTWLATAIVRSTPFFQLFSPTRGARIGATESERPLDYAIGETNGLLDAYQYPDTRAELSAYGDALVAIVLDDAGAGGAGGGGP